MDTKVSVDDLVNIKQEYFSQNSLPNMSSCMYAQQLPVGNMSSNVSKTKMFRFHMMKENNKDLPMGQCRRRLDFGHSDDQNDFYGVKTGPTMSVARRNERERNRVKLINMTFATLRDHLPYTPEISKSKKMSKVDTLKAAIDYIRYLQNVVDDHDAVSAVFSESCMQFDIRPPPTPTPQTSPSTIAISPTSESSFDALSTEEEELLDFATWF